MTERERSVWLWGHPPAGSGRFYVTASGLLLFLLAMIALGERVPLRLPVGASASPLLVWVFLVPLVGMWWGHVVAQRARGAAEVRVRDALDRATQHPAWWAGVAVGLAALVLADPPLLAAVSGVPGLLGLGVGAGLRLSAPAPAAAKP